MDKIDINDVIEGLEVELEHVKDKIKIASVSSIQKADIPILNSLVEDFEFTIKELTKIKNKEYVSKDELLSDEEIQKEVDVYKTINPDGEQISIDNYEYNRRFDAIAKALSSKVARPVDREKILEIIRISICKRFGCADSYKKQYPKCELAGAPCCNNFSIQDDELAEAIMSEIEGVL